MAMVEPTNNGLRLPSTASSPPATGAARRATRSSPTASPGPVAQRPHNPDLAREGPTSVGPSLCLHPLAVVSRIFEEDKLSTAGQSSMGASLRRLSEPSLRPSLCAPLFLPHRPRLLVIAGRLRRRRDGRHLHLLDASPHRVDYLQPQPVLHDHVARARDATQPAEQEPP